MTLCHSIIVFLAGHLFDTIIHHSDWIINSYSTKCRELAMIISNLTSTSEIIFLIKKTKLE